MHCGIAQIEIAVFQAHVFAGLAGSADLEGQRRRAFAQHLDRARRNLDEPRFQLGVHGIFAAADDLALHAHRALLRDARKHRVVVKDDLRHAVMVAQIHKEHAAVVADGIYPAREGNFFAYIALSQLVASMRSEHFSLLSRSIPLP